MGFPLPHHGPTDVLRLGSDHLLHLGDAIGRGSGSTVYRATLETRSGLAKPVALKLFHAVSSDEIEAVASALARTAARAACVLHPNVVDLLDTGVIHAQPFFVLELVEGVSLEALMARYAAKRARVPLDLSLFIAMEILEALGGVRTAAAPDGYHLGMLHLSLTAREVLLSWRGEVKVGDFELCAARSATSSVRSLDSVSGRASTMSPEVARGYDGDARSDVFSMGVLMREMLVGPRFPPGLGQRETVRLAREGYVQPMTFQPHLPEHLVAIMQRAIAIDPNDRHPNASAMAFELRRVSLAMGVGDGRWFLRRALDREWGNDATEATTEVPSATPPLDLLPIMEMPVPSSSVVQPRQDDEPLPSFDDEPER